jgi:hypothetical protein
LSTRFNENIPVRSEVVSGGHTQTDDSIRLLPFLENRLKWKEEKELTRET